MMWQASLCFTKLCHRQRCGGSIHVTHRVAHLIGQESCSRNVQAQHCLVNEPLYLVSDASSHNVLQERLLDLITALECRL